MLPALSAWWWVDVDPPGAPQATVMSNPNKPPSLDDLSARINKARHEQGLDAEEKPEDAPPTSGVGLAWRVSIELVTAIVVCTGIGWSLDYWFETTPWIMLVMFVLGAAAGINNVVKVANKMDAEAQREAADRKKARQDR